MMESPVIVDGSFLEGGGQILRLSVTYSAIFNIPVRVINIRANRPKPGLAQQHLHGVKLVAELCNGRLKGDYIGSTEIELWPNSIKGGNFRVHLSTAGSIGLMLQCALPVALFASSDVSFSLGGGTDCQFAPLIDYTRDILGHYLKKFGVNLHIHVKQRGLYPKGGGKVEVDVKTLNAPLKPIIIEDPGKCSQILVNVLYTGLESEKSSGTISKLVETNLRRVMKSTSLDIKTKVIKESRIIPGSADTTILDVGFETSSGCKLSCSRIFDNPRGNKRNYNSRQNETISDNTSKYEQAAEEVAQEIAGYIQKCVCCDWHMQDQLIVYMALADGTSRIIVDQITDHTKTTQYVTNLMTKAQVNFIQLDDQRHVIECIGVGVKNSMI